MRWQLADVGGQRNTGGLEDIAYLARVVGAGGNDLAMLSSTENWL